MVFHPFRGHKWGINFGNLGHKKGKVFALHFLEEAALSIIVSYHQQSPSQRQV